MEKRTHILITGGGTLGPAVPLLAIVDEWRSRDDDLRVSWIGTPNGPEKSFISEKDIPFFSLPSAKLSRNAIWQWPFMIPIFIFSCAKAYFLLRNLRPDFIFSAGGYVSVPVIWIGKLLNIPSWVHQLDVKPGLANKLMAPFASRISVTWKKTASAFPRKKTYVVGGIERPGIRGGDGNKFLKRKGLEINNPTILVMGGGTGSESINNAILAILPDIINSINVIHITGIGKNDHIKEDNYFAKDLFVDEMPDVYASADIVISRAGMGTILELAVLRKPTILIPIPNSHQELNAKALEDFNAAIVIHNLKPQILKQEILHLIDNGAQRRSLEKNISKILDFNAEEIIVDESIKILSS